MCWLPAGSPHSLQPPARPPAAPGGLGLRCGAGAHLPLGALRARGKVLGLRGLLLGSTKNFPFSFSSFFFFSSLSFWILRFSFPTLNLNHCFSREILMRKTCFSTYCKPGLCKQSGCSAEGSCGADGALWGGRAPQRLCPSLPKPLGPRVPQPRSPSSHRCGGRGQHQPGRAHGTPRVTPLPRVASSGHSGVGASPPLPTRCCWSSVGQSLPGPSTEPLRRPGGLVLAFGPAGPGSAPHGSLTLCGAAGSPSGLGLLPAFPRGRGSVYTLGKPHGRPAADSRLVYTACL